MRISKQQVLSAVRELAKSGQLSEAEVLAQFGRKLGTKQSAAIAMPSRAAIKVTKVLYVVGGLIIVAGVVFLVQQMWDSFGAAAQITVTLGTSLALYVSATFLHQSVKGRPLSAIFFVLSGVLMPVGIAVVLHHVSPGGNVWLGQLVMSGITAIVFGTTYALFRNPSQLFLSILLTTWATVAVVGLLLDTTSLTGEVLAEVWSYVVLALGIAYGFVGYAFDGTSNDKLTGPLFFLGSAATLLGGGALTTLAEWWMIVYFLIIFGVIYLSTLYHSRSYLVLGAIALIVHLMRISFEYFADSLGWPLALIIAGFVTIGVGYGTVVLHQRFVREET